jgi:hypothetical protein
VTYIITGIVCFGVGAAVSRFGVWVRFVQLEVKLRYLANQIHEETILSHDATVPADWVLDQLDTIVNKEFR